MTIWDLNEGQSSVITCLQNNAPKQYIQRLRDLGFEAKETIKCLKCTPFSGPKIFQIGDSVFSLTEEIAASVGIQAI